MKIQSTLLLAAVIGCLSVISGTNPAPPDNQLTRKEKRSGWQLLFDGKTMAGWRSIHSDSFPKSGWLVEGGCLIVIGKSPGAGDLITIKEYNNFDLSFDFKLTQDANSGIKYFVNSRSGLGPEYQIIDDERPMFKTGNVLVGGKLAGLYGLISAPDTKKVNPAGEWNTGRIVSNNNHVEHWLNGELMLRYVPGSDEIKALIQKSKFRDIKGYAEEAKGHILIQYHGSRVSYKNIKIKEL